MRLAGLGVVVIKPPLGGVTGNSRGNSAEGGRESGQSEVNLLDFYTSHRDCYVKLFPKHLTHIFVRISNIDEVWNLRALAKLAPTHLPNLQGLTVDRFTSGVFSDDYYALEEFRKRGISVSFNEDYLGMPEQPNIAQESFV